MAARVGPIDVGAEAIHQIALRQGIALDVARDRAIRDALFGLAAEGFPSGAAIRAAIRARLARAALTEIAESASVAPPSDEEIEAATVGHFLELNRPEGFRVVHAVARTSAKSDDAAKRRAREAADQVARVVVGAKDASDFEARARGVVLDGVDLHIETLDPVAKDGRLLRSGGGELVKPFSEASARLAKVGDLSPVTETEFGFHVIMLLERTAAKAVPLEERRAILKEEIVAARAREASAKLLERLRKQHPAEVERSAGALMQSLQVLTP